MTTRRNALGRGIEALLPSVPSRSGAGGGAAGGLAALDAAPGPPEEGAHQLPLDAIDPNPDQPRRVFDPEQLATLAESIRRHGVLQPVVVRRAGSRYQLLVGERRWRATREAGLATIPAVVADVEERDRLDIALVENVQRHDLNPIELAHAFRTLAEGGATQEEIGGRVGLDRSTVANHLRLLELPRELQEDVEGGRVSTGHAKALLSVDNPERRRHLRDRVVRDGLSVRATEELARDVARPRKRPASKPRATRDPNLQRLVDSLRQRFQTRIRIQGEASRGRIEIEYFGPEDLDRILGLLLGDGADGGDRGDQGDGATRA
jgi:ParB family chromosome partitioning protein